MHLRGNSKVWLASLILASILVQTMMHQDVNCGPTNQSNNQVNNNNGKTNSNNNKSNGNRNRFLSNLFRRQTSATTTTTPRPSDEEQLTPTEMEAQKFIDSLPSTGDSGNERPTSFRERVSDTFGVLRDGMSNQYRSWRDNLSETFEDIRDTWSSGSERR